MFRRKDNLPLTDPLPYGLRADLQKAGEKLVYRARSFHAAFGKDADALQRDFLTECRLSVLVFLNRKGTLSPLDQVAYAAAFSGADLNADTRTLLPRAAMRSIGHSLVLARQRGLTKAPDLTLTENEQATLEPVWNIIEFIAVLPGNRNGREFVIGEQGRVRALLKERLTNLSPPGASKNPTLPGLTTPQAPQQTQTPRPSEPSPQPAHSLEPAVTSQADASAPSGPASPRPVADVFSDFRWADAFRERAADIEGGKFFMPASVTPTIEQAALRYRTAHQLLVQTAGSYFLAGEVQLVRQYHLFLLGAFFTGGLGVTLRDLRVLARVLDVQPELLNLEGWRKLGHAIRDAATLDSVAQFVPEGLLNIAQRAEREVGEDFVTTAVESALVLFDVLLALGSDDDGTRATFRRQLYEAQRDRAKSYLPSTRARAFQQLPEHPSPRAELLGDALGERFGKIRATVSFPARTDERRESLREDFARHFLVLFATAVRQPGGPQFYHHSVTVMNRLSNASRDAAAWRAWHDEALLSFALDPFVFHPEYLRELLHAARVNPTWRATLDQLVGTAESVIMTFVHDVLGEANRETAAQGFMRLRSSIGDRLGPVIPVPETPEAPTQAASDTQSDDATSTRSEVTEVAQAPLGAADDGTLTQHADAEENAEQPEQEASTHAPDDTLSDERWDEDPWDDSNLSAGLPTVLPTFVDVPLDVDADATLESITAPLTPSITANSTESVDDVLREADSLVGRADLKRQLQQITNLVKVREMRRQNGLPIAEFIPHLTFAGRRGSGRTLGARLVGRLYRALGVLPTSRVTEVNATQIMAGDASEATLSLQDAVSQAVGGVLLIDRAYALTELDASGGHVATSLLRRLDEQVDDLVVIVAGEADRIEAFLNAQGELATRFGRVVHFENFTPAQLAEVLGHVAGEQGYEVPPAAAAAAEREFERLAAKSTPSTYDVRVLFEEALTRHANRVAGLSTITAEDLVRFEPEDFTRAIPS